MIERFLMLAFCGILAAPVSMHAQPVAHAMVTKADPADVFNVILTAEEKDFVEAAEAMPADKFNYAPTLGEFKGVRTFAEQIKHVAEANYYFFGKWNVPNTRNAADIEKLTSKSDILQAMRDSFAFEHAAIGMISAEDAFEEMGPDHGTRAGMITHALAHMMDHYGQMIEYLRMNGIVPPASRKPAM